MNAIAVLTMTSFMVLLIKSVQTKCSYEEFLATKIDNDLQDLRRRLLFNVNLTDSSYKSQYVGSTYVRWGHNSCPDGSKLVYDGYAAGKKWNVNGGGANYLCLTKTPEFTNMQSENVDKNLYGVETDINGFIPPIAEHDMSCAICFTPGRTSVLMVPGQKSCPVGWTEEYWGYLMANGSGSGSIWQPTQYICADNKPVGVPGGEADNVQSVVYLVGAMCGSLKCPPYIEGKPLTCVVCSR